MFIARPDPRLLGKSDEDYELLCWLTMLSTGLTLECSHRQLWLSPPCHDSVFHTMSANDRQPGRGGQSLQAASRSSQSNRAVFSVGQIALSSVWD